MPSVLALLQSCRESKALADSAISSKGETDAIEQVSEARVGTEPIKYGPEFQRGHKGRVFPKGQTRQ
jgi:hypothetical protein